MLDCHNPNREEGVRIFIGSDTRAFKRAEVAMEYSIRKHASGPVKIEWMDYYRGNSRYDGWNRSKWYTPFTLFRFAIPEFSNFEGRSIWCDVDQIFLDDIYKLINLPIPENKAMTALNWLRTDVAVFDNAKFKDQPWWHSVEDLKKTELNIKSLCSIYKDQKLIHPLPRHWCLNDKSEISAESEQQPSIIHFTDMDTQPWKPYPKGWRHMGLKYPDHRDQRAARIWWEMYAEALEDKFDLKYVVDEKLSHDPLDKKVKYK